MRLAVLLLAAALPVPAAACLSAPGSDAVDGPCLPAGEAASTTAPAPALIGDVPRPPARPDRLAAGGTTPSEGEDSLLSPQATLFWDVV